jgi:integrase
MTTGFGWTQHFAHVEDLEPHGFGHLTHVPFIRDSSLAYATLPNRFLIDRTMGIWDAHNRGRARTAVPPSRESVVTLAYSLINALEWADTRGIDLMRCEYSTVLIPRYQREMLTGIWSASGKPLKPSTVNARVGAALEYQMWGADKGLRDPVSVPTTTTTYRAPSYRNSRSHETKTVEARQGKVRVSPSELAFPAAGQIEAWRKAIHGQPTRGSTEGLLVDLILDTAIRREEAACWRVDTLPLLRSDWRVINPGEPPEHQAVLITLRYGTKGKEYGRDHGDKIGPEGNIHVPLQIAERIDQYREKIRPKALAVAVREGKSVSAQRRIREESVHLFLNPRTGKRYTGKQIYSLWTAAEAPSHWSPHMGRHWWACMHLERRMQGQAELMAKVLAMPGLTHSSPMLLSLADTTVQVIQLEITPQLRHASSQTTETYLEWWFNRNRLPYQSRVQWGDGENGED